MTTWSDNREKAQLAKSILLVDDDFDDFETFNEAFHKVNPPGLFTKPNCHAALDLGDEQYLRPTIFREYQHADNDWW